MTILLGWMPDGTRQATAGRLTNSDIAQRRMQLILDAWPGSRNRNEPESREKDPLGESALPSALWLESVPVVLSYGARTIVVPDISAAPSTVAQGPASLEGASQ